MSIVTVKFYGLCYDTMRSKTATHKYDTDKAFVHRVVQNVITEHIPELQKVLSSTLEISAFDDADDWLHSIDKTDIMHKYNFYVINNWAVVNIDDIKRQRKTAKQQVAIDKRIALGGKYELHKPAGKEHMVLQLIDTLLTNDTMKDDMLACYAKMHDNIKQLSYREQFEITLSSVNVAYTSALTALNHLKEHGKKLDDIPKNVWHAAFNQGNMTTEEFIKQYLDGTLNTAKYLN